MKRFLPALAIPLFGFLLSLAACSKGSSFDREAALARADAYDVVINRDKWGVPHVFGKTDAAAAFGFAVAQAEDDWKNIDESIILYRGQRAGRIGQEGAVTDYLVQLLRIWPTVTSRYDTDLSKETRAYLEAFADGINYWAALNLDKVDQTLLPVTAQDVVAGYMFRHLLFYGLDKHLADLNEPERKYPISRKMNALFGDLPIGSNAFAVAPGNTPDQATRLAINSHQPLTGPVAWYEGHIQSEEGLDIMGGVFPGSPTISLGFNNDLAWAVTVNKPDLVDIYVLDINPDDEDQYRLDGKWVNFEKDTAEIPVNLFMGFRWTFTRELLFSIHGPVMRTDHGTYAIRYAGMHEIRQPEQWYRMNKARTYAQWRDAMRFHSFASFNFVYADKEGNIAFVHNSQTPKRVTGYNWQHYVPGDDSSLIWDSHLAYDDLPQVINPKSGYVHSANQTPFLVSAAVDNPDPDLFRPEDGFQSRMTNRAYRGLELFAQLGTVSREEFRQIKFDRSYSPESRSAKYISQLFEKDFTDQPKLKKAQDLLRSWNFSTDLENKSAALGVCVLSEEWKAEQAGIDPPDVSPVLKTCVDTLETKVGRLDPKWAAINRHIRGDVNIPLQGGPDTLRAIYGLGLEEDGYLTAVAGDGLYYLVEWDKEGKLHVEGIHHYGSATQDETSPHYADQAPLFAREELKDPLFDPIKLAVNLERSYRPQDLAKEN